MNTNRDKTEETDSAEFSLPIGTVLSDRYTVTGLLGSGGFGITYLADDGLYDKKVAVKEFFPKDYAAREEKSTRVSITSPDYIAPFNHWLNGFIEEAKILIRIKQLHGVVKLLDFFETNNTAYIVTDYLEGESFRTYLINRNYKITAAETFNILRPVFESLSVLHAYGVIHKDISPENIQIVRGKYVKLIDFGAAALYKRKFIDKPFIVHKQGYTPIELYKPNEYEQGPWTDIYQMGATIFNAVTGYIPALASERAQSDLLPLPSALGADISPEAEQAVMKALAVEPHDRYGTVNEFMTDLGMLNRA